MTLIPEPGKQSARDATPSLHDCWGTAYEIPAGDPDGVLAGLDHRERGGYDRVELEIALGSSPASTSSSISPLAAIPPLDVTMTEEIRIVPGLVYIAGPENPNYLGVASVEEIARQVASAAGPSGANPDYVFELARSLRTMGAVDEHVFAVEQQLRRVLV